jgi:hypothetical protein
VTIHWFQSRFTFQELQNLLFLLDPCSPFLVRIPTLPAMPSLE